MPNQEEIIVVSPAGIEEEKKEEEGIITVAPSEIGAEKKPTLPAVPAPPKEAKEEPSFFERLGFVQRLTPEELEKREAAGREIAAAVGEAGRIATAFLTRPLAQVGTAYREKLRAHPLWNEERGQLVLEGDPNETLFTISPTMSAERRREIVGAMKIFPGRELPSGPLEPLEIKRFHAEAGLNTIVGLGKVQLDVAEGLSSPVNLAILGGLAFIPAVGAARLTKALVEAGFSVSMAQAAADEIVAGYELKRAGKDVEAGEKFAGSLVTAAFSLLAGRGAVANTRGYLSDRAKLETANREAGMSSEQAKETAEIQASEGVTPAPAKEKVALAEVPKRPRELEAPGIVTEETLQSALDAPLKPSPREILEQKTGTSLPTRSSFFRDEPVEISVEGQKGFFRPGKVPKIEAADPVIESVLTAQATSPSIFSGLKDWFGENFIFEYNVRDFPALQNDLRLAKDFIFDAARASTEDVVKVVAPLSKSEYETFRRTVILRDLVDSKKRGLPVPQEDKGLTLSDLQSELIRMESAASPNVESAIARHQSLTEATARNLVERGKAGEQIIDRPYYRHFVLDDAAGLDSFLPGLPQRLKKPFRAYTKRRIGSSKDIDTDYIDVMHRHLTKVRLDNLVEDFAVRTAEKYDRLKALSTDEQNVLFGEGGQPIPGRNYLLPDGRNVKGWQLDLGNTKYKGVTVNEKLWAEAVASDMSVKEFAELTGPSGGPALREALVVGGKFRTYLLDSPIADRLSKFREPRPKGILVGALGAPTRLWKRITLDFAGVSFQMQNLLGDLMNLYSEDVRALSYIPLATKAMHGTKSPSLKAMVDLAYDQRVIQTSGIFGGEVLGQIPNPRLSKGAAHLRGIRGEIAYWNPLHMIEVVSAFRESVPRLAKFMADADRIQRGESVVTKSINIKGLSQIDAAGKVARNFTVDYGAITPAFAGEIRSVLFPFATFFVENTKRWSRYVTKNPGDAAIKFGIPLAAMWTWNNTGDRRETESKLPEWQRTIPHIITGWKTEEGKSVIIAMQTPLDLAAKIGGIDKIPMYLSDIRNGVMTKEQATEAVLKDIVLGIPREARQLSSPLIKVFDGLLSNFDPFTRRRIVPEHLKGTPQESKIQMEYILEQFFTPYGAYVRASRKREPGEPLVRFLTRGPFDVKRALGIREVDLERAEIGAQYERFSDATMAFRTKMGYIEEAFITAQVSGDNSILIETAKSMNADYPGDPIWNSVKIRPRDLTQRFKSPRVQIEILKRKLQTAATEQEEKVLEDQIRALERKMLKEAGKGVPKAARPGAVKPKTVFDSPLQDIPKPPSSLELEPEQER